MFADGLPKTLPERRGCPRRPCRLRGEVLFSGFAEPVEILDMTGGGARVSMRADLIMPNRVCLRVALQEVDVFYAADLLWRNGPNVGLALSSRREGGPRPC